MCMQFSIYRSVWECQNFPKILWASPSLEIHFKCLGQPLFLLTSYCHLRSSDVKKLPPPFFFLFVFVLSVLTNSVERAFLSEQILGQIWQRLVLWMVLFERAIKMSNIDIPWGCDLREFSNPTFFFSDSGFSLPHLPWLYDLVFKTPMELERKKDENKKN